MWIFPLMATVISAIFAGFMARQYLERRRPAQLAWTLALFTFATGSGCDLIASLSGWDPLIAKLYYLSGAVVVVGYLAAGTLYLLAPRLVAHAWAVLMLAATVAAVVLLAPAGVNQAQLGSSTQPGWEAIDRTAALSGLAAAVNIIGTLILAGGAAYSAVYRRYTLANLLIMAGTLIVASGGTLTRLGHYEFQSIGQAAGIIVIFFGFLLTSRPLGGQAPARPG